MVAGAVSSLLLVIVLLVLMVSLLSGGVRSIMPACRTKANDEVTECKGGKKGLHLKYVSSSGSGAS